MKNITLSLLFITGFICTHLTEAAEERWPYNEEALQTALRTHAPKRDQHSLAAATEPEKSIRVTRTLPHFDPQQAHPQAARPQLTLREKREIAARNSKLGTRLPSPADATGASAHAEMVPSDPQTHLGPRQGAATSAATKSASLSKGTRKLLFFRTQQPDPLAAPRHLTLREKREIEKKRAEDQREQLNVDFPPVASAAPVIEEALPSHPQQSQIRYRKAPPPSIATQPERFVANPHNLQPFRPQEPGLRDTHGRVTQREQRQIAKKRVADQRQQVTTDLPPDTGTANSEALSVTQQQQIPQTSRVPGDPSRLSLWRPTKIENPRTQQEIFLEKVQNLASRNGIKTISKSQNTGCAAYDVILNDDLTPFAVLKPGHERDIESFVYEYVEEVGLYNLVAPSFSVTDFLVDGRLHSGTIEAFIPLVDPEIDRATIPADIQRFITKYVDSQGALTLLRFYNLCKHSRDRVFFSSRMNKQNLDNLFILYVLTYLADMANRNALVTLNSNFEFELRVIDTDKCFFPVPMRTFVLGFPQAGEPLTDSVRTSLIPTIIQKMPSFESRIQLFCQTPIKEGFDRGDYSQQFARMESLSTFLYDYPSASPRALSLFAFWNTFSPFTWHKFYDPTVSKLFLDLPKPQACEVIHRIALHAKPEIFGIEMNLGPQLETTITELFQNGYTGLFLHIGLYHQEISIKGEKPSFEKMLEYIITNIGQSQKTTEDVLALLGPPSKLGATQDIHALLGTLPARCSPPIQ